MGNPAIAPVDPENITDEERKRLLNRHKCRLYREKHRNQVKTYHRNYHRANATLRPSMQYQVLERRIKAMQSTITKHTLNPKKSSDFIIARAQNKINELRAQQVALNYTPFGGKNGTN